jgi:phytoene dehydrogenase-like protein
VVETVSPYSFYRFCGAYKGSYMSFILTPFAPKKTSKGRVKGLSNLYLTGQWLQPPGGLPNAAVTGKFTIQRLCKDLKVPFKR